MASERFVCALGYADECGNPSETVAAEINDSQISFRKPNPLARRAAEIVELLGDNVAFADEGR
jgi:hypothetical protein